MEVSKLVIIYIGMLMRGGRGSGGRPQAELRLGGHNLHIFLTEFGKFCIFIFYTM